MLAFLIITLFSSLCSHPKIISGGGVDFQKVARLWKYPWRRFLFDNLKKFLVEISFHSHLQLCQNIFEWLVSYVRKKERVRNKCQNKWNKDFLTKTGFLRSLFIIFNKKTDVNVQQMFHLHSYCHILKIWWH